MKTILLLKVPFYLLTLMIFLGCDATEIESQTPINTNSHLIADVEGNVYKTVKIGSQIWMAENLRTTKFNDGHSIPCTTDNTSWSNLRTSGYCWSNNDTLNKDIYGGLYNWYAVNSGKLAPIGWHVPSDAEWEILCTYLGGQEVAGGKLKEIGTEHWIDPNTGATNETGFGARGTGVRNSDGTFAFFREMAKYWTSTPGGWHPETDAYYRGICTFETILGRSSHQKIDGHSVRCVKDE